jgi:hypothetical protein
MEKGYDIISTNEIKTSARKLCIDSHESRLLLVNVGQVLRKFLTVGRGGVAKSVKLNGQ